MTALPFRMRVGGICAAAVFTSLAAAPQAVAAERDPVIFVHGWNGSSSNFDDMIADFEADGYPRDELRAWDYNTSQSNVTTAEEFVAYVDGVLEETGAGKVDVVTHSMGGLNSRWYLKFEDGTGKVDDWVSLGGPNHGTTSAQMCLEQSCVEMRPGSDFLTTLNSGDETPGTTSYGTWWSPCDEVIYPQDSTVLSGAANTETACLGHSELLVDDTVSAEVRAFVA